MIAWSLALPQTINVDSFGADIGDTVLRSDMDVGPAKTRRRATKSVDVYTVLMDLTIAQYQVLYDFFDIDLNGGTTTFSFTNPLTGDLEEFRMFGPPKVRPKAGGGTTYVASMIWERMPQ